MTRSISVCYFGVHCFDKKGQTVDTWLSKKIMGTPTRKQFDRVINKYDEVIIPAGGTVELWIHGEFGDIIPLLRK